MGILNKEIKADNIDVDNDARTDNGENARAIFVQWWSTARIVMEAVVHLIKNPIVKMIFNFAIRTGDALYGKLEKDQ